MLGGNIFNACVILMFVIWKECVKYITYLLLSLWKDTNPRTQAYTILPGYINLVDPKKV